MAYPDAYCVKCGKHTATNQKHTVVLQNAARALKGVCSECSTEVYKILPKGKSYRTTVDSSEAYRKKFPDAFCVKCKEHTPTLNPETVVLHNGARAMRGSCKKCGSDSYRILGKKALSTEKVSRPKHLSLAKPAPVKTRQEKSAERRVPMSRRAEVESPKANKWANAIAFTIIIGAVVGVLGYTLI